MDFEQVARNYLENEKQQIARQVPPGVSISLNWRSDYYIGSIQQIALGYDPEIVLLSKTSKPIQLELHEAISRLQPDRLQLTAENILDLEGRLHVVRRVNNNLTNMTAEQMTYMQEKHTAIMEQTGQITTKKQSHYYGKRKR